MKKSTKIGLIIGVAAILVIAGVILLLILLPKGDDGNNYVPLEFNSVEATVDEDGIRTVNVPVDAEGNLKENVSGSLFEMEPNNIKKISLSNASGNYEFEVSTDADGATTYVLLGFEDYELNGTYAAMIGSAISDITMETVVDVTGEKKADYGLDSPKITVTAEFDDGSKGILYIGDDAPGSTNTYVSVEGCDAVFSVLKTEVEALTRNLNEMFSTGIRSEYSTVSDEDFTYITLGGTHLEEEITLEHAPDGSLDGYYILTSHNDRIVNTITGSNIIGSVKSLSAKSVAFVNPDSETLKSIGLDNPYATVKAQYVCEKVSDDGETVENTLEVSMIATKPDADGVVYLMNEGGKFVYTIGKDEVDWVEVTLEDTRSQYVFAPSYSAIKGMTISNGDESYTFEVDTLITEGVDEETGEEISLSESVVKFGDKTVEEAYFRILFEDIAFIPCRGAASADDKGDEVLLTVTYSYNTGREDDTVVYYATDSQKVIPEANGVVDSYIYKTDIEKMADNAKALSEGKEILSIAG